MPLLDGDASNNKVDVNSDKELLTDLTATAAKAGKVLVFSESDPAVVDGRSHDNNADVTTYSYTKAPETSEDYRLRVGISTQQWCERFLYAAQNTNNWLYRTSTMTTTWTTGSMILNGGASVAAGATIVTTYRTFTKYGAGGLRCTWMGMITAPIPQNWSAQFGLFTHNTTAPYPVADGVYFQIDSEGFSGRAVYANATAFQARTNTSNYFYKPDGTTFKPLPNVCYKCEMLIDYDSVKFWIDDKLYAIMKSADFTGKHFAYGALPAAARCEINGVGASANPCQLRMLQLDVTQADYNSTKPFAAIKAGMGMGVWQYPPGTTIGQTAQWAYNAAPTAVAPTATTGPAGTVGLGGLFNPLIASLAINTDYIVQDFLNPVATTGYVARTLYITGIRISAVNLVIAVAAGGLNANFAIRTGNTAISGATTEAATAKKPRMFPVGGLYWPALAAIGIPGLCMDNDYTNGNLGNVNLKRSFAENPIIVQPGEWLSCVMRFQNYTTAVGESLMISIGYDGYWE